MANEFKIKKGLIVSGSGGTLLDVQGSVGQVFSVTDSLTGDIFSVSDISGIPIFNVNSSGLVTLDGTLNVSEFIRHEGDTGTSIQMLAGQMIIKNSGGKYINLHSNNNIYYEAVNHVFYNDILVNDTITSSKAGINFIMDGAAGAEGIRMTADSSTTYPVFLRATNPASGESSPWLYKEANPAWGIWHNNPTNSFDFTRSGGITGAIATNVGGGSNSVMIRLNNTDGAGTFAGAISASNFSGSHSGTSSGTNTGDQDLSGYAQFTDVAFTVDGNDVVIGDALVLAGGLTWTDSTKTLTSANDNTTYTASTGLTLTGTAFSVTANTYAATYTNHAVQGNHDMHTWDKVHAVYSDDGGSDTYWIITTNVPQDNYSMGGFELIFEDDYSGDKEGGTIKIYGYWNPESNSGFTGFKYTTDNPNLSSGLTIQVGRNTSGKTCFAISGHNQNYAQIIAKNLWLGYNASSASSAWGDSWSISTSSTTGLTNLNTVTKVPDARWDNIQGKPTTFAPSAHNHDTTYLKLAGGTMSGNIDLDENRIEIFENAFIEGSGGQIDIGDIDGQDSVNGVAFYLMDQKIFSMNEDGAMLKGNLEFTHNVAQTSSEDYGIVWTGWDKEGITDNSDNAFIKHDTNQGGHSGSVLLISSMNDANDGIAFSTNASSLLRHNGNALYSEGHKPTYTELGTMAYTNLTGTPTIPSGSQLVRVLSNQDYIASGGTSGDYRDNYGLGLTIYEGYNTGANRPHTYDTTAQFMSTTGQGFELSIDWVSASTTPLKIRSLRDCCQGWSSWTNVWTSHNFTLGSGGNLDADKVDGLHASSFIRSDADDTASGTYLFTGSAKFALDSSFANSEVRFPATTDQNPKMMFYRPSGSAANSYPWRFQAGGGGSSSSFYIGTGSAANNGSETIANKLSISSTGTLTVSGDVIAYGSPSDAKYKENVKPIENALDKVMDLEGVSFDWKENSEVLDIKEDIGFIAQDVQKVIPELVRENEDGNLSLRYQGLIPVLLEAMKEQQKQIDELKLQMAVSNKRACNCKK